MRRSHHILFLLLILGAVNGYCDPTQQGIFKAGGLTDPRLLYPGDSISSRKIEVLDEKIAVQVYRGFAVVKGEYKMHNTSGDLFTIKVGYPVNSSFSVEKNSIVSSILFDPLYALKSYCNGRENMIERLPVDSLHPIDDNNWYVWTDTVKPHDTSVMSVYFIVNTNNAEVTEELKHDANNAFLYLAEAGPAWKQPVQKGEIKIELMDDLKVADIRGVLPGTTFQVDEERNILDWQFTDLSPVNDNNVVLVYTPNIPAFDFSYVSQRRLALFGSIDAFFQQPNTDLKLTSHTFDSPYKVKKVKWNSLLSLGLLVAGSILGLILLARGLRLLIRYIRDQRPQRGTEM